MNTSTANDFLHLASSLHKEGLDYDQITFQLREKGAPESALQEVIQQLKNIRLLKKRNVGFACCGIGATIVPVKLIVPLSGCAAACAANDITNKEKPIIFSISYSIYKCEKCNPKIRECG